MDSFPASQDCSVARPRLLFAEIFCLHSHTAHKELTVLMVIREEDWVLVRWKNLIR